MSLSSTSDSMQSSPAVHNSHPTGSAMDTESSVRQNRPNLHSFSGLPSDPLHRSDRPAARKVSFSDFVITSSRVEKPSKLSDSSPTRYNEQVTVVEKPIEDETGPRIQVELIRSLDDDLIRDSPLAHSELPIFEVRLGMLKQATVYQVQFEVPDSLPAGEVELVPYMEATAKHTGIAFNTGAKCRLLSCESVESGNGHNLVLELSTTRQPRVNEFFTMRRVQNPSESVFLVLHGLSLARGQGTPFLRLGIHRVSENPDFDDSDEFTEWPGFVSNLEEEEEEEEEEELEIAEEQEKPDVTVEDAGDEQPACFSSERDRMS